MSHEVGSFFFFFNKPFWESFSISRISFPCLTDKILGRNTLLSPFSKSSSILLQEGMQ